MICSEVYFSCCCLAKTKRKMWPSSLSCLGSWVHEHHVQAAGMATTADLLAKKEMIMGQEIIKLVVGN